MCKIGSNKRSLLIFSELESLAQLNILTVDPITAVGSFLCLKTLERMQDLMD